MNATREAGRIVSMDQFRGYTVAGMCLVNFLGGYAAIHPVLKHNNNYFSYADSIMPGFLFACGFSYRLSALRASSDPAGFRAAPLGRGPDPPGRSPSGADRGACARGARRQARKACGGSGRGLGSGSADLPTLDGRLLT
jgi:hypothetical protein